MTNESANSPFGSESKTVESSTVLDNPDNLNFWEPGDEEKPANPEQSAEGIESEADEAIEDGPSDEPEDQGDEPAETEEGEAANEAKDDIVVTLKGGEQVPLEELKLGYLRERDYRHKTHEIGNKGRALEAMTTRVANSANAIAEFLIQQLPVEPTRALAMRDPNAYTQQKAAFDEALAQVNRLIDMGAEPKQVGQQLSQSANEETLAAESEALAAAFPQTRTDEGRTKFFNDAFGVAEQLGFSKDELKGITDHRMFKLAHYARLGLAAEQAKGKALAKVAQAPPATVKAKPNGQANQNARTNQDAMKRLSKTGSIKDAMSIDFD